MVRVTQRTGNTYVTTGVGIWFLTLILLAAFALYLVVFLVLFVGILLILRWVMRRWTWTEYVGGVLGLVFFSGIIIRLCVGLVQMFGWTGVWTAALTCLIIFVGIGLFLLYSYDQAVEEGWMPTTAPATPKPAPLAPPEAPPLSESEKLRVWRNW